MKFLQYFLLTLVFLYGCWVNPLFTRANTYSTRQPVVLMIDVSLNDMKEEDRLKFEDYKTIVRSSRTVEDVMKLAKEHGANTVLLKYGDSIYEYDQNGMLISGYCPGEVSAKIAENPDDMPGGNIPDYLFPGTSKYSYLIGEGENPPVYQMSKSRGLVSELAGTAQNSLYPFWVENSLRSGVNVQELLSKSVNSTTATNLDAVGLGSNGIYNLSNVAMEWFSGGLGFASTGLSAYLDHKELKNRRLENERNIQGIPYSAYQQLQGNKEQYYPTVPPHNQNANNSYSNYYSGYPEQPSYQQSGIEYQNQYQNMNNYYGYYY